MSRGYYIQAPPQEYYHTYYRYPQPEGPVRPMVFHHDDGVWNMGQQMQRGRLQHRHSDRTYGDHRQRYVVSASPRERPVIRVAPQKQQQQQQKQFINNKHSRARSASPIRLSGVTQDKMYAFNSLRKEMKEGFSGLKHVSMDIPKFKEKSPPTECYKAVQQILNAMDRENRKWKKQLNDIFGQRSVPSTPRTDSEVMTELQRSLSNAERKTVEAQEANSKCELLSTECRELKERIQGLEAEKEALSREKNEATTRLSEVAGSKLQSGNAAIADLSTDNRPTKIAEKFRELYDNEWTEAVEVLFTDDPSVEKKVIGMLLYIVKESYSFCVQEVDDLKIKMKSTLLSEHEKDSNMGREAEDLLAKLVKSTSETVKPRVVKKFMDSLENDEGLEQPLDDRVKTFANKCCELTWFMTVQSPQMYIDCDVKLGSSFNPDLQTEYTRSGTKVEFVVWPIVYIERNGALLSKGVVQPVKTS